MALENLVISKSVEEVKTFDEEDAKRFSYERVYLRDFVDEQVYCGGAQVSDITSEMKISQKGNEYQSNKFIINYFDDTDEMNIAQFVEVFRNYQDGKLTIGPKSELLSLVQTITGDYKSNRFVLDFEVFREVVGNLTDLVFTVEEVFNNAGYANYVPKFTRAE